MMVFADYQSVVLETYERKKAANVLSRRLAYITPANLKEECAEVCQLRYSRKDEPTLRAFFGEHGGMTEYIKAIRKHDTDKFRPLVNLIKGKVNGPDEKYVELLAWLIDFDQRPHVHGKQYHISDVAEVPPVTTTITPQDGNGVKTTKEEITKETGTEPEVKVPQREGEKREEVPDIVDPGVEKSKTRWAALVPPFNKRSIIMVCSAAVLIAVGVYLSLYIWPPRPEGCMYWAGDHYERISCNEKKANTLIIAYDEERLEHFRQITTPDTITYKSVGRVWYIKLDGSIEFYTAGGHHPVRIDKKLHPVTDYIIRVYCQPAVITVPPPPVVDSVNKG